MTLDIAHHRLYNQQIATKKFNLPGQMVAWFGAMQAQDYAAVKWAIGLRCDNATHATIEQAIIDKTIIRTWLMRGTLHVTAAAHVRWMLALLAPRLIANSLRRYRQLELDEATFARSFNVLTHALEDNRQLTRAEIMLVLEQAGIITAGQRGYHILGRAGLEGLICFGPMPTNQQTFVLLDEWLPDHPNPERAEALAKLAECYFRSHGPATLQDFRWWSGLPMADARAGLELAKPQLYQETIAGQSYWLHQPSSTPTASAPTAYLLPAFDEYFLGYQNRDAVLDATYNPQIVSSNGVFRPIIVLDGQIVGIWKQAFKKETIIITPNLFKPLTNVESQALLSAVNEVGAFFGLPAVLAG